MVRKEDLCNWFKALPAHKRLDYLCDLLRLCLPLELRFLGTVLEDLAKKDFHVLRDQEIKANQRSDLSSNNSSSLSDTKLRAKIITALALMNSNNSPCADIIFEMLLLQNDFNNISELLRDNSSSSLATDLSLILTMAVRHPAFSFYQRNQLGQILEKVETYLQGLLGDDFDDGSSLIIHPQTSGVQHYPFRPSQSYGPPLEKGQTNTRQGTQQYHPTVLIPQYPSMGHYSHCSTQMSSTTSSPGSSRTSSPSPLTFHVEGKSNCTSNSANVTISDMSKLQPFVHITDQTFQLLHILHLEEYYEYLKDCSLHQIFHMSKEDFAKAGLPPEVQAKLHSSLSQVRLSHLNGQVDASTYPLCEVYYAPPYHYSFAHISHPYLQHFIHPTTYSAQTTLHPTPQQHDSSSTSSDTSSRPPSPLAAGQSLDYAQGHITGHLPPVVHHHQMVLPLIASHVGSQTASDMKRFTNQKLEHADSSDSENDKSHGQQMFGTPKTKGYSKPQQSQSVPLINEGVYSRSSMGTAKVTDMLISMTAPHGNPTSSTAELKIKRTSSSPLSTVSTNQVVVTSPHVFANSVTVVNKHQSDHSINQLNEVPLIDSRTVLNSKCFQTALPAKSNVGLNNIICPQNLQHQFPSQEKCNSVTITLPVIHDRVPLPSYIPVASSIPSTHVIGLTAGNYLAQLGPQPHSAPLLFPEPGQTYPKYFISHIRGTPTTIANSMSVTVTTQSHPSRPHTTSPVIQQQTTPYVADVVDSRPEEPGQMALKSPYCVGGSNSCRSSPPFAGASQNQITTDIPVGGRGHHVGGLINGFDPKIIYHQSQQQSFSNCITSNCGSWLRLPFHIAPNYYAHMYGSLHPQSSGPGTAQTTASPTSVTTSIILQNHGSGSINSKSTCYNCGYGGHQVSDCQESRMEAMTNTFHLRYNPNEPPV